MAFCVLVPDRNGRGKALACLFQDLLTAELWVAGIVVKQMGAMWQVWTPSVHSLLPKKIIRWIFNSKEEAEAFVKGISVEEKKSYRRVWIN